MADAVNTGDIEDVIAKAMAKMRSDLSAVEDKISLLQSERNRLISAPAHTDDIVAAWVRGLDGADTVFTRKFGRYINSTNHREVGAAKEIATRSGQMLLIGGLAPPGPSMFPLSGLKDGLQEVDVAALTFFLRPLIEERIPALVEKLCPAAQNGMKQADRDRDIKKVDDELAILFPERDRLKERMAGVVKSVYERRDDA